MATYDIIKVARVAIAAKAVIPLDHCIVLLEIATTLDARGANEKRMYCKNDQHPLSGRH